MDIRKVALASALALAFAGTGFAQTKSTTSPHDTNKDGTVGKAERKDAKQEVDQHFKAADTNNDGFLSKAELSKSKHFESVEKNFAKADTNNDGKISLEERNNWAKSQNQEPSGQKKKKVDQK